MPRLPVAVERVLATALLGLPEPVLRRLAGRPVVRDGNTLAAETQLLLALSRLTPAVEELPLARARAELDRQAGVIGAGLPIGAVRDLTVPGAAGDLAARLYTPTALVGGSGLPTLLFFHGGGFVYGGLDSHDGAVRHLAEHAGVQVLAIDYRLAPEHPFPAAHEDCVAAFRWLATSPEQVQAHPARLAVGGDSAGGNLAASTALAAAAEGLPLAFQLLVYPVTEFVERSASRRGLGTGFYLTDRFIEQAEAWYTPTREQAADPRVSVLRADVPAGVAPALVVTAGFDPLRDEGRAYARKLAGAGVAVEHVEYGDMIHSFFNMVAAGRLAPAYNREIAGRLARAVG